MASISKKRLLLKILSFISVIRGYNILVLVIAQYLTSIFILAPDHPMGQVLFDPHLFFHGPGHRIYCGMRDTSSTTFTTAKKI
jgi:hypothetical protein